MFNINLCFLSAEELEEKENSITSVCGSGNKTSNETMNLVRHFTMTSIQNQANEMKAED